ncbi:MAG: hypothetical protein AMXMBFR84_46940 [Candidatus Hydrogenedentota bacterium]
MNHRTRTAVLAVAALVVASGAAFVVLQSRSAQSGRTGLADSGNGGIAAESDVSSANPLAFLDDLTFAKADAATINPILPATVANFRLSDTEGKSHELYRMNIAEALVIVSHGTGCPIQQKSYPELTALEKKYGSLGFFFVYLNGNPLDTVSTIEDERREFGVATPVLLDEAQLVTNALAITRTAEVIVVTPTDWQIRYRGAIDDRLGYGAEKPVAGETWLRNALDAIVLEKPIEKPVTETKGCLIDRKPQPAGVSYTKHVAPIVAHRCATCHRDGDIGPFAFDNARSLASRSEMVREVLLTKRMPPWHADPHLGSFANDGAITQKEVQTIIAWIDGGASKDGDQDPLEDVEPVKDSAWPFGEPDVVLSLPQNVRIPAQGTIDYQYIHVPYTGTEDAWVRAAIIQPGNMRAVHHVLVFVQYPPEMAEKQPEYEGGLEGYFAGYVPGSAPSAFPSGSGKYVPKGSTFVFQMHYTATGKPETDLTKMGLYLCPEKPDREFITTAAYNTDFSIPPGTPEHPIAATYAVARDTVLYSVSPHMHYRGKSFSLEAQFPDGRKEMLLSVPFYDFNWQTLYEFKQPISLPAGTHLVCNGAFDNSATNPMNPDPSKTVYFGEQSYEEMFIGYMNVIETKQSPS